jgi:hypothetical protein
LSTPTPPSGKYLTITSGGFQVSTMSSTWLALRHSSDYISGAKNLNL